MAGDAVGVLVGAGEVKGMATLKVELRDATGHFMADDFADWFQDSTSMPDLIALGLRGLGLPFALGLGFLAISVINLVRSSFEMPFHLSLAMSLESTRHI